MKRSLDRNAPPTRLSTLNREVHIWRINLANERPVERFWKLQLHKDELARASRFRFDKDRQTFTITRGVLRYLVQKYSCLSNEEVRFAYNAHGKPLLVSLLNLSRLQFNVTHSRECALIAFGRGVSVGIDAEYLLGDVDVMQLARVILSRAQFDHFAELPVAERRESFYRCWTCKEAVAKAVGHGFSMPFDSFDVSFQLNEPPRVLWLDSEWGRADEWTLHPIEAGPSFAATLAVNSPNMSPRLFDWPSPLREKNTCQPHPWQ